MYSFRLDWFLLKFVAEPRGNDKVLIKKCNILTHLYQKAWPICVSTMDSFASMIPMKSAQPAATDLA